MPQQAWSLEFVNRKEYEKRLEKIEEKIIDNMIDDMNEVAEEGQKELQDAAPKDTGDMSKKITVTKATKNDPTVEIRAGASYTVYVDKGTKPHFPPVKALIGWAERHPYQDYTAEQSAFLIARAISKRGTKAQNFISPVAEKLQEQLRLKILAHLKGISL